LVGDMGDAPWGVNDWARPLIIGGSRHPFK
jgi:hypothetical protein